MRLKDKNAIITGGAGEIGFATAERFLKEGARVMLVDLDEEGLKEKQEKLKDERVTLFAANVTREEDVKAYAKAATEAFGSIDIFFNNAGIEGAVAPIIEYGLDEFRKIMDVNVNGVFLGMKHIMPKMQEQGGSIIISSSVAGLQGTPGVVAYTASKHALIGIMRVAALEGAEHGIRVNTIHPGVIDSRMMDSLESGFNPDNPEAVKENFQQTVPLGRYGQEKEIAQLVTFLASEEASYSTGATFVADGGMTAG